MRTDLITRSEQIKNETQDNANTAQRVGSLFEDISSDAKIISEDIQGRAFYNGTNISIALVSGTPKRIEPSYDLSPNTVGFDLVNDRLVAQKSGRLILNGMISFQGYNGGKFKLQLRKNDNIVCLCNPLIETMATRVVNLVSTDFVDVEQGDTISLWIVDEGSGGTLQLKSSKIVTLNI